MYRDIPEELLRLIEPVVEAHGCELVDVESRLSSSRTGMLRVTIDRREGDGRVAVESCAEISRELGTTLDAHDIVPGTYNLEVSSPGMDRILAREKDFAAACGQDVKLRTRRPVAGRRQFRGRLVDFEAGVARLLVDGQEYEVPFADVEKANSMYEFTREDFGKGNSGKGNSGKGNSGKGDSGKGNSGKGGSGKGKHKSKGHESEQGDTAERSKSGARNR